MALDSAPLITSLIQSQFGSRLLSSQTAHDDLQLAKLTDSSDWGDVSELSGTILDFDHCCHN